jgi:hypothetical protein
MAVLDRFVEALLKTPGAQSMKLVSGFPTELVVNGAPRPVSRSVPTTEQIFGALGEVLPESFLDELRVMPSEATYASPYGPVKLRARFANDVLTVWLMPGGAQAPAPAPRGPASEEPTRPVIPRAATSLEARSELARVPLARVGRGSCSSPGRRARASRRRSRR